MEWRLAKKPAHARTHGNRLEQGLKTTYNQALKLGQGSGRDLKAIPKTVVNQSCTAESQPSQLLP